MTLSEAIDKFLASKKTLRRRPATLEHYSRVLGYFEQFMAEASIYTIDELCPDAIMAYIKDLNSRVQASTAISYLSPLSALVNFLTERGYIDKKLIIEMPKATRTKFRNKVMDPKTLAAMLQIGQERIAIDGWLALRNVTALAFLADTACRVGGLCSLHIDRLDLDGLMATLEEKGGHMHEVYFGTATADLLHKWLAVRPKPTPEHGFVFVTRDIPLYRRPFFATR